jgi:protein ImuB
MVVCIHIPRFALLVAVGRARIGQDALAGRPMALAPLAGAEHRVGEVSSAAEAHGIATDMALGEALARCPELELIAADPMATAEAWEGVLKALEGIGAALEPASEGLVYFRADELRGMHGSDANTIALTRRAIGQPVKIGMGPTRFCALGAALSASLRRTRMVEVHEARRFLFNSPVSLLGSRQQTAELVQPLERLGVRTLGELWALGRDALADRFGEPGVRAHRLAGGKDDPLVPRAVEDPLEDRLAVGDANSGAMLQRILGVLVDQLLARPERRGRSLRVVVLSARLVSGGTWRERVVLREALGDSKRICLALSLRLMLLPAPAESLSLAVERFGPEGGEQHTLLGQGEQAKLERLKEAVSQVRAVGGDEAALRAVCIDPDSRVPERRTVLAPLPG